MGSTRPEGGAGPLGVCEVAVADRLAGLGFADREHNSIWRRRVERVGRGDDDIELVGGAFDPRRRRSDEVNRSADRSGFGIALYPGACLLFERGPSDA